MRHKIDRHEIPIYIVGKRNGRSGPLSFVLSCVNVCYFLGRTIGQLYFNLYLGIAAGFCLVVEDEFRFGSAGECYLSGSEISPVGIGLRNHVEGSAIVVNTVGIIVVNGPEI